MTNAYSSQVKAIRCRSARSVYRFAVSPLTVYRFTCFGLTMNRQSSAINGFDCSFALEGNGDRPVVVLSHPLATSMDIWGYQLPLLRSRFRVLLYDIRGHGRSVSPGDNYTLEALAEDVAQLLDYLDIRQAAFVGLSIGGMIGQLFALEYPEKVSALVLCSTGSRMEAQGKANLEQWVQSALIEGMKSQVEARIQRWLSPNFIAAAPAVVGWVSDLIRSTSVGGFVGCCRAIQGLNVTQQLNQIRTRTLLIPGELDQGFPPSVSQVIQQQIAGSELKLLPGAAHLGNVERAHAFNEILVEFLDRAIGSASTAT